MTRQFFVGGNFKMNPASREAKRALVKILNDATLDPNTGEQNITFKALPPMPHLLLSSLLDLTTWRFHLRGRHRTPGLVSDPHPRPFAQRRQGRGTELPLQDFRCIHGRDQVGFARSPRFPQSRPTLTILLASPTQLVDAGVPYVILGAPRLLQILARGL
jgi:hypothetical protein